MPKCRKCGINTKWKHPYKTGDRPVNLDGSRHYCEKPEIQDMREYIPPTEHNPTFCGKCKTKLIDCKCDFCSVYKESWCDNCKIHPNRALGGTDLSWEGEVTDMTHPTIDNIQSQKEKLKNWNKTYLNKQ